ncbi:hypothetical protein ACFOL3_21380 [Streptomyces nitrosporeus]
MTSSGTRALRDVRLWSFPGFESAITACLASASLTGPPCRS